VSAQLETSVLPDTKRSFDWVDGVIGARFLAPLSGRVPIAGRGDIAGFGSDLTWQAHADLRIRLSDHWTVGGGYRYIDTDYDKGSGTDRKLWSMVSKGPYLGVQVAW
jgi:opacity protein-like surface antigen